MKKLLLVGIVTIIYSCKQDTKEEARQQSQSNVTAIKKTEVCCQSNIPSRFGVNTLKVVETDIVSK